MLRLWSRLKFHRYTTVWVIGGTGGGMEAGRGAEPGLLGVGRYCWSGYATHRLATNIYSPKGIPRTPKYMRFYLMLYEILSSRMWRPYVPLSLLLLHPGSPEQLTGWHAMYYTCQQTNS